MQSHNHNKQSTSTTDLYVKIKRSIQGLAKYGFRRVMNTNSRQFVCFFIEKSEVFRPFQQYSQIC